MNEEISGAVFGANEYYKVNNPTTSAMKPSTKFTDDIF
jgi:hypothetical protein